MVCSYCSGATVRRIRAIGPPIPNLDRVVLLIKKYDLFTSYQLLTLALKL